MNRVKRLARQSTIGIICLAFSGFLPLACTRFPASPFEIGQLSLGAAYDVFVQGDIAFVSDNEGVAVIDLLDLEHPHEILTIPETGGQGGVAGFFVSGDTLLVLGLRVAIYDLTDPTSPQVLSSYQAGDLVTDAEIRGRYVYLTYLGGGLEVIDFLDPANPASIGYVRSPGLNNDLTLRGNIALVANSSVGLEMYDIANPGSPRRTGVVPGTEGAWDIHIDGDMLFLGCHRYGAKIIDISDPSAPSVVGSFDNGGEIYGVQGLGDLLYTVDLQQGVEVLDISNPGEPVLIAGDDHYHPHDLYIDGVHLYLADQDRHFVVLPLDLEGTY